MISETHTLPVLFTTQTPYPLPSQKFMIPAAWKRYQLSQLVNKALSLLQPIPFDFLVRGEVLRSSLAEWCNRRGIGTEETLEIEYVESLMPPQRMAGIPHDDWVSSVSSGISGHFVTASYDALVRVFDTSQSLKHTISGHTAAVSSVCVVPSTNEMETIVLASASHDATARLTALDLLSPTNDATTSHALASLHLHTAPISSVSASSSGTNLLTAGWDTLIGVWDTSIPSEHEVAADAAGAERVTKKRRKGPEETDGDGPKRKAPLAVLKSHTGRVTGAIFGSGDDDGRERAFSCALDSTVRCWDIENGVCVNTLTVPEKPFLALALLPTPHLLAAASTDRTVSLYDVRQLSASKSSSSVGAGSFSHPAAPHALAPSPTNAHHIASGATDGTVRVWDVRSTRAALVSFRVGMDGAESAKASREKGDGKILGMDWVGGVLAVGGEGGLDVWRVPESGAGK